MQFFLLAWYVFFHPFYVAVVELHHNPQAKTAELTIRCFADDLEDALALHHKQAKPNLVQTPRTASIDSLVVRYVKSNLLVKADDQLLQFNYVGAEMNNGYFYIFLEAPVQQAPKNVQVMNRFLYDVRKEQTNLHHISVGKAQESYRLQHPEMSFTVKMD